MANVNSPSGFQPVSHLIGGPGNWTTKTFSIASAYDAAIYKDDPVELTGTGDNIQIAPAGNEDNIGSFQGVEYTDANGRTIFSEYWPANTVATNVKAKVAADPNTIFEAQADSATADDLFALADWVVGTGSTINGRSGAYLAVDGATGTTGKSMVILGKADRPDNEWGAYCKVLCMFREHNFGTGAAGAGGV